MTLQRDVAKTARILSAEPVDWPSAAVVVLGSGLADIGTGLEARREIDYDRLPAFPKPRVGNHKGQMTIGLWRKRPVILLRGRAHYYESGNAAVMQGIVASLSALGVQRWLLTNAAGGLNREIPPGSLMLLTDHINFSGLNPLIDLADDGLTPVRPFDARFVDMVDVYDPAMRLRLSTAAETAGIKLHLGVYAWFSGPSFETPAEIRAATLLGAHAVGMSTVPEVILARYYGVRSAAISIITNLGAGMEAEPLSHTGTLAAAGNAAVDVERLLQAADFGLEV